MTDEELTGRFDSIDQRFDAVDQRFGRLEAFIKEEGAAARRHMEAFVREEGATTRRHFDIVAESMKADVKVISEGHGALVEHVAVLDARGWTAWRRGRITSRTAS
jgi:hypothetical protein